MAFTIGQRVKRPKIYNSSHPFMYGEVVAKFSEPMKRSGELILGPYPELYSILWDGETRPETYLPHGVTAC